jgi:guanylate kinase
MRYVRNEKGSGKEYLFLDDEHFAELTRPQKAIELNNNGRRIHSRDPFQASRCLDNIIE